MRRKVLRRLAVLGTIGVAAAVVAWRARPDAPPPRGLGQRVDSFALKSPGGQEVGPGAFADARAVVLVFLGTDCPVGNLYAPRLKELAERYEGQGVTFVGVNSNAHESAEMVADHREEYGLPFPVLKDEKNALADRLRVERTCEAVVLGPDRVVRYHGAIDDQYARGSIKEKPTRAYLAEAIDAVLEGREVLVRETSVLACPIDREAPERSRRTPRRLDPRLAALRASRAKDVDVGPVTFADDVAPILRDRCEGCHRPGEVAPFPLENLEDARRWGPSILEVVDEGLMPPWHADPRYGEFVNDRSLSNRERSTLIAWVEQDMPAGDLENLPPRRPFPSGWTIGVPDLVFEIPEAFDVPAEGVLEIQRFEVPTGFDGDVWVQAAQVMPGDRAVVHHVCVFIIDPNAPELHSADREARRDAMPELVCYAPGDMPAIYPDGVAKRIPAGASLDVQVHYTPIGIPRFDRTSVGIRLARAPVTRLAVTRGVSDRDLVLPPGKADIELRASYTIRRDAELLSLTPHMHYRGRSFRYDGAFPDGRRRTLLVVPSYDFNWQNTYRLADPIPLPAGTRIECVARFDNSAANPANPDPAATVRWGEQSTDEMMIGYLDYSVALPSPARIAGGRPAAR